MNTLSSLVIMELVELSLCAVILVAAFKIPRLRRRLGAGLDVAMSYLSGYFRTNVTVNVPEPDYERQTRVMIAAALASNPRVVGPSSELHYRIDEILKGMNPPAPVSIHTGAHEDIFDDDGPNYEEADEDEEESGGII